MAHPVQRRFCRRVKRLYPDSFLNVRAADVGSGDINGNNRYLFRSWFNDSEYIGIDLYQTKNVDVVGLAHEVLPHQLPFDTIISTECLEHDAYWRLTLKAMYSALRPGGLMLITAGGLGRTPHGITGAHAWCSPATNSYYANITNDMFLDVLGPRLWHTFHIGQHQQDFQFYGIKNSFRPQL